MALPRLFYGTLAFLIHSSAIRDASGAPLQDMERLIYVEGHQVDDGCVCIHTGVSKGGHVSDNRLRRAVFRGAGDRGGYVAGLIYAP